MSLTNRIKQGISELKEQSDLVSQEYGGSKLRWKTDMIWCFLRYGARPIDYNRFEFHKKSGRERNRYLTIIRYFKNIKHFGSSEIAISGKKNQYSTFAKFIKREYIFLTSDTSIDTIKSFLEKHGKAIAKPVNGEQGKGVFKIELGDETILNSLYNEIKDVDYVLEEVVSNCKELAEVNPSSLNTVRVTTLSPKNGKSEIVSIILRAGVAGSAVDNWGAGGVGYNFDVSEGICFNYGKDKLNKKYLYHPGANKLMVGFKLPKFKALKEFVYELAECYPKARYVGWDIAITPNGFELIEMNCPAGHDMFQSFDNPIYYKMKKLK